MNQIATVSEWLREADRLTVLTGAGISAESGVPLFRGPGGLWREFRPEELATPEAFTRDPRLVWEWYDWRRGLIAGTEPNPAHYALAQLEENTAGFTLVTQNVDGLHDRAGSREILKLHGDLWDVRCMTCGKERRDRAVPLEEIPPHCDCGGLFRPGVVWFGEALPADVLADSWEAAQRTEVFLVVGTSALVQPAASLPMVAREHGARLVEINLEETPLSSHADISLLGKAGELLPLVVGD